MDLFGGIEAGGTKFVCAVGSGPGDLIAEARFSTTDPEETLTQVIGFFEPYAQDRDRPIRAIGIGAFGPLDIDPASPSYGAITTTPKPGWANTPLISTIQSALQVPVAIDTDVNAAAIGEGAWGAAVGLRDFLYLTIGTGIGGGAVVNGQPVHGLVHPEIGHILVPHDRERDPFPGSCPFHSDCFEGLANGPAVEKRWGVKGQTLPPDHPAWPLEAHYIALALHSLILSFSPRRIILGGGVMQQLQLFPLIRRGVVESLNGYVHSRTLLEQLDEFIVPPALGGQAGVLGSIALARRLTGSLP